METLETAYAVIAVEAKVTDDPGDDPAELPAKRADAIDVAREGMAVLDPYTKSTAPK